jgi:hypothetical protein
MKSMLFSLFRSALNNTSAEVANFVFQMIFLFIPALLLEIFSVYFFISMGIYHYHRELWVIIEIFLWDFFLLLPPNLAIIFCSRATKKVETLTRHLEKYSNFCDDASTQRVNFLLTKLYNRPIVFSCGFFNINLQLGLSIISTVTTYMVIIFQFDMGRKQ